MHRAAKRSAWSATTSPTLFTPAPHCARRARNEPSPGERRRDRPRPADPLHFRWPRLQRLRRRYARLGVARRRRRRRRPQLQDPSAARRPRALGRGAQRLLRPDARRPARAERARHYDVSRRGRRARRAVDQRHAERRTRPLRVLRRLRALHALRLLLQDLPLAELEGFRAGDPRHGRPRPHRPAMEAGGAGRAAQPALRGSDRRRRARRPGGGACGGGSRNGRAGGRRPASTGRQPAVSRRRARRRRRDRVDRRDGRGDRGGRRRLPRQRHRLWRLRSRPCLRVPARRRRRA